MENATVGTVLTQVFANDSDAGPNALISYSLYKPTEDIMKTFGIDNSTGEVFLLQSLDRETEDFYEIIVQATDAGTLIQRQGFGQLVIQVLDINDEPPKFSQTQYFFSNLSEDSLVGILVGTVEASDRDLGNGSLFSFALADPHYQFEIDSASGEVTLNETLDFEDKSSYNLTVLAVDAGSPRLTGTAYVIISILPVNDNGPMCDPVERLLLSHKMPLWEKLF